MKRSRIKWDNDNIVIMSEETGQSSEQGGGEEGYRSKLDDDEVRTQIKFITYLFVVIGVGYSITALPVSVIGSGTVNLIGSFSGILLMLGSIFLAGIMGLYVGEELDEPKSSQVAGGVGSFLGGVALIIVLIPSSQIFNTGLLSGLILPVQSVADIVPELLCVSVGIGVVGSITGHLGATMETRGFDRDEEKIEAGGYEGFTKAVKSIPQTSKEEDVKSGIKLVVLSFAALGVGYATSIVLLRVVADDTMTIMIALVFSYIVIFSSGFFSAVLGYIMSQRMGLRRGIATAAVGSAGGFVVLVVVLTVAGSLEPSVGLSDVAQSGGGALLGGTIDSLPKAYENTNILIPGISSVAMIGAVSSFVTQDYERWLE